MCILFIRIVFEYSDVVWDGCCFEIQSNEPEKLQLEAVHIVTGQTLG